MINRNIKNNGFTLIETLVAVLILSTAIAGPLTIAAKALNVALVAKDQTIAYYLAQDAVEYVRFARDTNRLGGGDWLTGVGATNGVNLTNCTGANGCSIDSSASTITACSSAACTQGNLKYNSSTRFYSTTGAVLPTFTRIIKLTTPAGGGSIEKTLIVTVAWTDLAGVAHPPITAQENLFDWQ